MQSISRPSNSGFGVPRRTVGAGARSSVSGATVPEAVRSAKAPRNVGCSLDVQ